MTVCKLKCAMFQDIVRLLLENGANIDAKNNFRCSPIYMAVEGLQRRICHVSIPLLLYPYVITVNTIIVSNHILLDLLHLYILSLQLRSSTDTQVHTCLPQNCIFRNKNHHNPEQYYFQEHISKHIPTFRSIK